ncbi:hypothetical protein [Chroococcidiopsis sp.]|uniref:hypothetical protein n=1 Tax=Chroococcidiopsis sp. TaxID=3088168 RepID=UPI003F403717
MPVSQECRKNPPVQESEIVGAGLPDISCQLAKNAGKTRPYRSQGKSKVKSQKLRITF